MSDDQDTLLSMLPQMVLADAQTLGAGEAMKRAEDCIQRVTASREETRLPVDRRDGCTEYMTSLGFEFSGELFEGATMEGVTLPEGWKLSSTDHSMWFDITDPGGHKRFSMFYKSVMGMFVESAFCRTVSRLHVQKWHDEDSYDENDRDDRSFGGNFYARVMDRGEIRKTFGPYQVTGYEKGTKVEEGSEELREMFRCTDTFCDEAKAWLTESYPNWENDEAHWNAK